MILAMNMDIKLVLIAFPAPVQLLITGVNPNTRAMTLRALKVCNSYLYILDQVLLPTPSNRLSTIPEVNATFLQALASLGAPAAASSGNSAVGNITDPVSALVIMLTSFFTKLSKFWPMVSQISCCSAFSKASLLRLRCMASICQTLVSIFF